MAVARLIAILVISLGCLDAQTVINAVTDAASYSPRVSPGCLASIFGSKLASFTDNAPSLPLPRSLGGATVFITQSQQTIEAPLVYASKSQINFQVPNELTAGTAQLYVTVGGGKSLLFGFSVVTASPAIFQTTSNHAVAQNQDHSVNSTKKPAAVGSVVVVYMTGQGPVDHPVADGDATPNSPLSKVTAKPAATIGGMTATVQFLGLTPGLAGLAQANIQIPKLATGDYPLVVTADGYVSASATISVSGSGTAPPSFLSLAGSVSFPNGSSSYLAIYGNTTYVCGPNRIAVIDTSDVTNPVYDGEFGDEDLNGNGGKCAINTSTAEPILVDLVGPGSSPSFVVYQIADPTQPVKLGQIAPGTYTFLADLTFIGSTGFSSTSWFSFNGANQITALHGDFLAFDFSNLIPQLISALTPVAGNPSSNNLNPRPNALAAPAALELVYVASSTATGTSTDGNAALDVINVSSPLNLVGVDRVTVSDAAIFLGIAYDNNLMFLTGNTNGYRNPGNPDFNIDGNLTLTTMDITNAANPRSIATVDTGIASTGTYNIQPFGPGTFLFAIVDNPPESDPAGPGSLMIVDCQDTKNPVMYPFQTQFGLTDTSAANGYLLVPFQNGLNIYKMTVPTS